MTPGGACWAGAALAEETQSAHPCQEDHTPSRISLFLRAPRTPPRTRDYHTHTYTHISLQQRPPVPLTGYPGFRRLGRLPGRHLRRGKSADAALDRLRN